MVVGSRLWDSADSKWGLRAAKTCTCEDSTLSEFSSKSPERHREFRVWGSLKVFLEGSLKGSVRGSVRV